jgi:hypothetical protein
VLSAFRTSVRACGTCHELWPCHLGCVTCSDTAGPIIKPHSHAALYAFSVLQVRVSVMLSCRPACLHGIMAAHTEHRETLGGGLSVLDLDSYDLHVISGALQWVETALRACPALHAGVG